MMGHLATKVDAMLTGMSDEGRVAVESAVAEYVLLRDMRKYLKRVREAAAPDIVVNGHLREYVSRNNYCQKLWRAVFHSLRRHTPLVDGATKFGVNLYDTQFLWTRLTPEQKEAVIRESGETHTLEPLSRSQLEALIKRLRNFTSRLAKSRLRFIVDNDPSIDLEDMECELVSHGIQAIKKYEHFSADGLTHNIGKIQSYTYRAVNNHVLNILQYHTRPKRQRIEAVGETCGHCGHCINEKPSMCLFKHQNYQSTTASLHSRVSDSEDLIVMDTLAGGEIAPDRLVEIQERLDALNNANVLRATG